MAIIGAVLGFIVGSFINVVADGLSKNQSISQILKRPRSLCDHCKRALAWYELIPVASALVLGWRCRTCKGKIPWRYTVVELICGFIGLLIYYELRVGELGIAQAIASFALIMVLITLAAVDAQTQSVPEGGLQLALYFAIFYLLISNLALDDFASRFIGIVVAAAAIGSFVIFGRGKVMGEADLLLALILGLWLGFPLIIPAIMLSFIIGGTYGAVLLALKLKKRTDTIGFVPFLVAGGVIAFAVGDKIIQFYAVF